MPIEILMPSLSPTMKSGSIVKWYKKEGDTVKAGEVIADIETDKAVMEFEYADEDGIIGKILLQEGSKNIPINQLIALVGIDDNDLKSIASYQHSQSSVQQSACSNKSETSTVNIDSSINNVIQQSSAFNIEQQTRIKVSPLAKKIALASSINLNKIKGTGPYNRIIKADVLEAIQHSQSCSDNNKEATHFFVDVSPMRQAIANRLVESKQTIPHFYLKIDCNVDNLLKLKSDINSTDINNKITINDFIIKATALSIKEFPSINASWINDKILQYTNVDVSFAVSIDNGLITPIISNSDKKSLSEISHEAKDLIKKAKNCKLQPKEFQGGSITISNLGMFGIKEFMAIINPPQSCIIAVGNSEKKPVVINNNITIANIMTVTLSADHRVIDGVIAAQFFNCFKKYIENPITMLI
ncbi:pyruvate dehydrogenase complex dihydrolipoamide acetyltransferase [Neoehrlichia mikurensis]|uniref:Acetyltransferase component of pyruvate dehydrogenase complex n=1 Tax=Neoehrlichia mikurensis TaxID=89586 RepID=A0A9Q9BWR0_9RICK|nr:pyruvate dehydrogenase complex dihydrolipoamide acetyltransferase [Neoehrlichia mikurensis]QXK92378.1 pyruvate dehydrogenase complex dihydrolipoamide acetyltransferase [Neoehrlichia mikurensis]UTO55943.1 pyruvate dehydrogenase complex dihydrolipoamide acetyltransferase [Neoehrlichia mikurensis]UTO56859.1 pyruvate dehydrogenase complex dihydrolipoamide acetyltransferase [Neoehrlichia mikurensis]